MNISRPHLIALATALLFCSSALHAESALEVMQRVQNRDIGDDSKVLSELILVSKSGREKRRKLIIVSKDYGADSKMLIKFVEPKQLKNTGLLIHSFADKDNLQWLYLSKAGKKEPRKIPSTDKDDSFLGSEFYYVDFEENQPEDFSHTITGEEEFNGYSTTVVESLPIMDDYPYSSIVSWVDKATNIVVKVDIYQEGALLKTISVTTMEQKEGIDTAMETLVENHQNGKKSILRVDRIKYDNGVDDAAFTLAQLIRAL